PTLPVAHQPGLRKPAAERGAAAVFGPKLREGGLELGSAAGFGVGRAQLDQGLACLLVAARRPLLRRLIHGSPQAWEARDESGQPLAALALPLLLLPLLALATPLIGQGHQLRDGTPGARALAGV